MEKVENGTRNDEHCNLLGAFQYTFRPLEFIATIRNIRYENRGDAKRDVEPCSMSYELTVSK